MTSLKFIYEHKFIVFDVKLFIEDNVFLNKKVVGTKKGGRSKVYK